jgi:hypothetical protein
MRRSRTCYTIVSGDYSGYSIHRVFLHRSLAEMFIRRENRGCKYDCLRIEEVPLGGDGEDGLPTKVAIYTYQGVVWVPDEAVDRAISQKVAHAARFPTSNDFLDPFADGLPPEPERSKRMRKYLYGKPFARRYIEFADSRQFTEGVEVEDGRNYGCTYVSVVSFKDAAHARKMWQDTRARIQAEKQGIA